MKLLVSDYDGTFYTSDNNIRINNNKVREWMNNGNLFMISSGRCYNSILDKIVKYDIPVNYISSGDGSHLFDKNGNVISESLMSKSIVDKLDDIMGLNIYDEIQFGTTYEYLDKMPKKGGISSINFVLNRNSVTNEFMRLWNKLKNENPDYSFFIYSYFDTLYFCIKPYGVDKSTTIRHLEINLPLLKSNIYTVGDGDNDLCMIKDYNGFIIGRDNILGKHALCTFDEVHQLVDCINNKTLRR